MAHTVGPEVVAVFPPPDHRPFPGARDVWPDLPGLWTTGEWHDGELRTARDHTDGIVVIGRCLATDEELRTGLRRAAATGSLDPLADWPGSYTAILLGDTRLAALVDLSGQYPLHHRAGSGRVVLGSRVATVAEVAGLPRRPDPHTLAAQVFCPDLPQLTGSGSVLSGVDTLGAGRALRADRAGRVRTWTPDRLVPDPGVGLDEAAAGLRTALDDAVRARLATSRRVTADLSGGLDSTSVAFLALRHRPDPLRVFTYHHPDAPADDLAHASRFAGLDPRFVPQIVTGGQETLPYQDLPPAGDLPDASVAGRARTRLRLAAVAARGGELHLGGEGADALLAPPPAYLADLARRGAHRALVRHSYLHARQRTVRPAAVAARAVQVAGTSPARALTRLAGQLDRGDDEPVTWLRDGIAWWPGPGHEAAWLTGRMRRDLAQLCRDTAARADLVPPGLGIADLAATRELHRAGAVARQLVEAAREYRVWPQAPFLDHRVIRACRRVPASARAAPPAPKPLLDKAMAGLVPAEVFARTGKGNYLGEDYAGLAANRRSLVTLIADSRVAELGIVDQDALVGSIRAADQRGLPFAALNRLLGVELWLRADERGRPC